MDRPCPKTDQINTTWQIGSFNHSFVSSRRQETIDRNADRTSGQVKYFQAGLPGTVKADLDGCSLRKRVRKILHNPGSSVTGRSFLRTRWKYKHVSGRKNIVASPAGQRDFARSAEPENCRILESTCNENIV